MAFFSVIMQSTLKNYPGCAEQREVKLWRAIESVKGQTMNDWEMVIVADNCPHSFKIASEAHDERVKAIMFDGKYRDGNKWQSGCRNIGKENATGKYILYLDNDDFYLKGYLSNLRREIERDYLDWYICDHFELRKEKWQRVRVNLNANSAGTANIIHKPVRAYWPDECHYGSEDWTFIRRLMALKLRHDYLDTAGYCIAHKRGKYDT